MVAWDAADRLPETGGALVVGPPTSTTPTPVAVARAVHVFGWSGAVLPEIMLVGCRMIPVVEIDLTAHRVRERSGDGPTLDTDVLLTWEWLRSAAQPPPTALHLTGVLVVARRGWRRALRQLRSMRGFAPAGALVPPAAFDDDECRLEFALHGIGLVPWDADVDGLVVPESGTALRQPADRWIEEALYRHALDHGLYPPV